MLYYIRFVSYLLKTPGGAENDRDDIKSTQNTPRDENTSMEKIQQNQPDNSFNQQYTSKNNFNAYPLSISVRLCLRCLIHHMFLP